MRTGGCVEMQHAEGRQYNRTGRRPGVKGEDKRERSKGTLSRSMLVSELERRGTRRRSAAKGEGKGSCYSAIAGVGPVCEHTERNEHRARIADVFGDTWANAVHGASLGRGAKRSNGPRRISWRGVGKSGRNKR